MTTARQDLDVNGLQLLEQIHDQLTALTTALTKPRPPAQPLLDERTAAEFLAVKPQTLAAWRSSGKGPAYIRVGAAIRYQLAELQAYIRDQEVPR